MISLAIHTLGCMKLSHISMNEAELCVIQALEIKVSSANIVTLRMYYQEGS